MRFRTGLIIGLGVGYVLGAKAGRERYDQIVATAQRIRSNDTVKRATDGAERITRTPRTVAGNGLVKAADGIRAVTTNDPTVPPGD
ncbi:MAG: YtxH domain-containing protein [Acidimicrobiia bacterium]|nr:YtxH domain-containing protein [Acidimicrobiia bacterium]